MPAHVSDSVGEKRKRKLAKRKALFQRYKPTNLLRRFLIFVCFVLLLGVSWKTYLAWTHRIWDGKSRFSVVVASEDPTVYSFNPQTGILTKMSIPAKTEIEASHGYGSWFVGSLWQLGYQEGKKGEVLENSLKKSFGIPVDAFVDGEGEVLFSARSLSFPVAVKEAVLSSSSRTNLTFFDRVSLLLNAAGAGPAKRQELDLPALRVLKKETLRDGTEGYKVVPEQAKITLEKSFRDELVFGEAKTASIVNASGKSGLAGEVAQVASVLGIRVVGVSTDREEKLKDDGCIILGNRESLASVSSQRLAELFDCEKQERDERGLTIILGNSFAERF